MQATEFEFRYRFGIIAGLFFCAFGFYGLDPVGAGVALERLLARGPVWSRLSEQHLLQGIYAVGAGIVAFAALIRTWATAYLQAEIVHDRNLHASALVADGPYRRLRNPLYLGVLLTAAGFGLMTSRAGYGFLLVTIAVYLWRLIRREEAELARTQGESYAAYRRTVPSMIPALRPKVPAAGATPRWGQAFRGELFIWLYAAGELSYAITLRRRTLIIFVCAGFVVNALAVYGHRRRRN